MDNVLTLKRASRDEIRKLSVDQIGFPVRIVHAAEAEGVKPFGALWDTPVHVLEEMPTLGPKTIRIYTDRLHLINRMCVGSENVKSLPEWMKQFLRDDEFEVLSLRYGFYRSESGGSSDFFSLQEVANRTGRTRERIRQVESSALCMMRKSLPQAGLLAARDQLITLLNQNRKSMTWEEIDSVGPSDWMDALTLSALTYFIFSITPFSGTVTRTYTSTFPKETTSALDPYLEMQTLPALLSALQLAKQAAGLVNEPTEQIEKALVLRALSDPRFCLTKDKRCGLYPHAGFVLIHEVLTATKTSLHFREIARIINQTLHPSKPLSAGKVLDLLHQGSFLKTASGMYTLK